MTIEQILLHLKIDGFCVVEDVIPEGEVDAIRESSLASLAESKAKPPYKNSTAESDDHEGFININQSFSRYLTDDRVLGVAEALFGPHVRAHETLLIARHPTPKNKRRRSGFHVDSPLAPCFAAHLRPPYPDTVMTLRAFWFFTPFTRDNGATYVVPGSHRMHISLPQVEDIGVDMQEPYSTEMQVLGKAGSVLIWDTRLWHTNGINHSNESRVFLSMAYIPWWFNLETDRPGSIQNEYLIDQNSATKRGVSLISAHVYESLPEDVKPLFLHWVEGL